MKIKTMCMVTVLLFSVLVIVLILDKDKPDKVTYYAVWEDGRTVKTGDEYGAVPLFEPNDVADIYPYFIAEIEVDFRGRKLPFRSGPLIFSDNPEIQGKYGQRMVYYVKRTDFSVRFDGL